MDISKFHIILFLILSNGFIIKPISLTKIKTSGPVIAPGEVESCGKLLSPCNFDSDCCSNSCNPENKCY